MDPKLSYFCGSPIQPRLYKIYFKHLLPPVATRIAHGVIKVLGLKQFHFVFIDQLKHSLTEAKWWGCKCF